MSQWPSGRALNCFSVVVCLEFQGIESWCLHRSLHAMSSTDTASFCCFTVERRSQWSFCPFTGGFDMRVYFFQKGIRKVWQLTYFILFDSNELHKTENYHLVYLLLLLACYRHTSILTIWRYCLVNNSLCRFLTQQGQGQLTLTLSINHCKVPPSRTVSI